MWRILILFIIFLLPLKILGQSTEFHDTILAELDSADYEKAVSALNKHLFHHPEDGYSYLLRARAYEGMSYVDKALTNYNIYLTFHPSDTEALFSRGILRYQLAQYSFAIEDFLYVINAPDPTATTTVYFQKAVNSTTGNKIFTAHNGLTARAYYYIGLCYLKMGADTTAISYLDTALTYSQNNPDYLTTRALAKERLRLTDEAITDYHTALSLNPLHELARYNLSLLLADVDSTFNLSDSLSSLIDQQTTLPYPFAQRGYENFILQKYNEALADFKIAVSLEPDNEEYLLEHARTLIKLERYDEAEHELLNLLKINPSYETAYFNLAVIAHKKGQFKEAIQLLDLAIFYYSKYQKAYVNRAIAYYSLDQYDMACNDLYKAIKLGYTPTPKMLKAFCSH